MIGNALTEKPFANSAKTDASRTASGGVSLIVLRSAVACSQFRIIRAIEPVAFGCDVCPPPVMPLSTSRI